MSATTFRHNLAIALAARGLSQFDLSDRLGLQRSTVNKWVKGISKPDGGTMAKVVDALGVDAKTLESTHPLEFGADLGLTRNEIERAIDEDNDSLYLNRSNLNSAADDFLLGQAAGVYHAYMPSWVYRNRINCRLLSISYLRDSYYFSERHAAYRDIPAAEYSGYAGRVGNNIHLIGEEIRGIKDNRQGPRELVFATLRLSVTDKAQILRGLSLGSDPVRPEAVPVASPYFARKVAEIGDGQVERHLPEQPYLDVNDGRLGDAVAELSQIRQSWFTSRAEWPGGE